MQKMITIALLALMAGNSWAAATLYKSPQCGCCEEYVKYLGDNGFMVKAINSNDMSAIKQRYGSSELASCHTMRISGKQGQEYTVEGHVPVAAIKKLLAQQPKITGISVPGMPANSPGMGPEVKGTLKVYALDGSKTPKVFSVE
jgi:hypothetical protein